MKAFFLIIFLFTIQLLYSQDTTVTWLNNIDTTAFQLHYNKKAIPKELYPLIKIDKAKDIASADGLYQAGCVGSGLPRRRLNWIAKDTNNHWVLSISHGGYSSGTEYYFIDRSKGTLNVNCFTFYGSTNFNDLSFGSTIPLLKARKFYRKVQH
ncbi:MAG: hypothetical protein JWP12_1436 [Bacteroidetes bacterium]|nr:hypothetical protein [Bacteroidota bacterium]